MTALSQALADMDAAARALVARRIAERVAEQSNGAGSRSYGDAQRAASQVLSSQRPPCPGESLKHLYALRRAWRCRTQAGSWAAPCVAEMMALDAEIARAERAMEREAAE